MESEAYLKAISEIPKDIQDDVIGSINIANEIQRALDKKGYSHADLARKMGKSESEISKWLTGLHNFTFKTVRKIERVLDTKLIMTSTEKIECYNEIIKVKEARIKYLESKVNKLENKSSGNIIWEKAAYGYTGMRTHILSYDIVEGMNTFVIDGNYKDDIHIKPSQKPKRFSFTRVTEK